VFALLQLCDSLFPLGGFSYSDGLEAATASGLVADARDLRHWMDACLDETLGQSEGPATWHAWHFVVERQWEALAVLDAEVHAIRPSSTARAASRAMGTRLLRTWQHIHPHSDVARLLDGTTAVFTLPVAFGAACAVSDVESRACLEGFMYTRLAATVSTAMRLMAIGQHEAHALLSTTPARAPAAVDRVMKGRGRPSAFTPALDAASMSQQYVHSRLFRS
jgi:urease accessory protein